MQINYLIIRRGLYIAAVIALASLGALQAREGDWIAAAIAGLTAGAPLLAAGNTKAPLELEDPDRVNE